jgi:hypothetical protein
MQAFIYHILHFLYALPHAWGQIQAQDEPRTILKMRTKGSQDGACSGQRAQYHIRAALTKGMGPEWANTAPIRAQRDPRRTLHVKKQNILRRQNTRMLQACCAYARCNHDARMLHACCTHAARMLLSYCPHVACYIILGGDRSCNNTRRTSASKQCVC